MPRVAVADAGGQVLLVEHQPDNAEAMAAALRRPGRMVTVSGNLSGAIDQLRCGRFDVVITDLRVEATGGVFADSMDGDGAASPAGATADLLVLRAARRLQPSAETIMVSAQGDVSAVRAAFKAGVSDLVEEPVNLDALGELVDQAEETALRRRGDGRGGWACPRHGLRRSVACQPAEIIVGSEPMERLLARLRVVAAADLPVLITGETGTGKELIARALHRASARGRARADGGRGGRFVALSCAAETETLLEDQLFGHVRGAFTGADRDREGVFEYANHGTLFLDEIGDMPPRMQVKPLRVLESGEVVRLGSNAPRRVDVRVISATNQDLPAMIAAGAFRRDLYFRINGAHIHLPPLRERRGDIPPIVLHGIGRFAGQFGAPAAAAPGITDGAMSRLLSFGWPGNVRQLLYVVQHMVMMAAAEGGRSGPMRLDVRHLPADLGAGIGGAGSAAMLGAGSLAGASLVQLEKRAIRETLGLTGGNRGRAADLLGIGLTTLYRKLKAYGLR